MIIHPLLVAVYPLVALLAENIHAMQVSDAFRAILLSLLMSGLLLGAFRLLLRDWHRAAILASISLLLFFSYGHIYNLIRSQEIWGVNFGRHRYLIAAWIAIFGLSIYFFGYKLKQAYRITPILNFTALILLILPVFTIASVQFQPRSGQQISTQQEAESQAPEKEFEGDLPDVYYIILDGYARADVLQERYGYDNSEFIEFLESHGFYVADKSHSNYLYTALSIGSTLNMQYIQDLNVDFDRVTYPKFMFEPIRHSPVRQKFESYGYKTVAMPTGYDATEIEDVDYFLTPDMDTMEVLLEGEILNRFEELALTTSALRTVIDLQASQDANWFAKQLEYPHHVHRLNVLAAFENAQTVPRLPGSKFVFVHIISPHRPYLFGPDGEEIDPQGVFTFKEVSGPPEKQGVNYYLAQLTYITTRIEETIEIILARSDKQPIIVLQSDHGPGYGIDWEDPDRIHLDDRSAILNAYYLPDECEQELYPTITPVNSFRLVLNCAFGESYEMLPDISYFNNIRYSSLSEPWEFTPIDEFE